MMGRDRSRKAMEIIEKEFSDKFEAKCAGVSEIADILITQQAIDWAEKIICMERRHQEVLFDKFEHVKSKDLEVWDISSDYSFNDVELEEELGWQIKEMVDYG